MPNLPGPEVAERIRFIKPEVRVLVCSGYVAEGLDVEGAPGRRAPLLQKPFSPDALLRKVREVLDAA